MERLLYVNFGADLPISARQLADHIDDIASGVQGVIGLIKDTTSQEQLGDKVYYRLEVIRMAMAHIHERACYLNPGVEETERQFREYGQIVAPGQSLSHVKKGGDK